MPEITLYSKEIHTEEVLDLPNDAKIFHIEYIDDKTLLVFYTVSKLTMDELGKTPYPFGRG